MDLFTAKRTLATRGIAGVADAVAWRFNGLRRDIRRWWLRDHAWLGRFVELRGNWVQLGGCRFDVSHPQISRALRARLLRGRYERSELELLKAWLDPAAPVVELGGGIGVVATLVNRRLHSPAEHVVVEANPSLIPVLERQKAANGVAFTVEHAAVDYSGAPTATLRVGDEFIGGRLGEADAPGTFEVPTITLARLLARYPSTGGTLICDIEGVETQLVAREGHLLRAHFDTLVIEVHPEFRSQAECDALFAQLAALGFERVASVRKVHAFRALATARRQDGGVVLQRPRRRRQVRPPRQHDLID